MKYSFEFLQSIYGQYSYFYFNSMTASLKKQCFNFCLTRDSLSTKNLVQGEKNCLRECLLHSLKLTTALESLIYKHQQISEKGEDLTLLDYIKS